MEKWKWSNDTKEKTIVSNQLLLLIEAGLKAKTKEEKEELDAYFERVKTIYDYLYEQH